MTAEELKRIRKMLGEADAFHWGELNIDDGRIERLEASSDPEICTYVQGLASALASWRTLDDEKDLQRAAGAYEIHAEAITLNELKRRAAENGEFSVKRHIACGA